MIEAIKLLDLKALMKEPANVTRKELLQSIVTGTTEQILGLYDPSKTYKLDDKIAYVTEDGEMFIIACIAERTTGAFKPLDWEEWNVVDEIRGLYDDFIICSWHKPSLRRNKIWLEIKDESIQPAKDAGYTLDDFGIMIYQNFVVSERRPLMTPDIIWGQITEVV